MRVKQHQRIMVIGAHPDDVEMNAGGSIHKWVQEGHDVCIVVITGVTGSLRHTEVMKASLYLGVGDIRLLEAYDTRVHYSFNLTLGKLETAVADFKPDTVVTHFHADTHQDHVATYQLAIVAARKVPNFLMFKPTYPSGRPDIPFHPQVISLLSESDMQAKIKAINAFESQRVKYGDAAWTEAMGAVSKGDAWTYAGVHGFAEVFQLGRLVM